MVDINLNDEFLSRTLVYQAIPLAPSEEDFLASVPYLELTLFIKFPILVNLKKQAFNEV